jgi:hypothetical protein
VAVTVLCGAGADAVVVLVRSKMSLASALFAVAVAEWWL